MEKGLIAVIIIMFIIVGAMLSRRCVEFMLAGSFVAAAFLYGKDFMTNWCTVLQEVVSENVWIILVCGLFGSLITLLQAAKGTYGFSKLISRFCVNERRTLLTSFIMGILIFVDDYLNVLSIGVCMKGIYDKRKIPREVLAYLLDATGAPVCVILPFSTWAVFYSSLFIEQDSIKALGFKNGMDAYIHAIPYAFYPIITLLIVLLFCLGIMPKLGNMKKAYQRVEKTGMVYSNASRKYNHEEQKGAEEDGNIRYFFNLVFRGFGDMLSVLTILVAAFMLQKITEEMGMTAFIIRLVQPFLQGAMFPAIAFILVTALTFTTASQWGISAVASSIVFPLGAAIGANPILIMAAIISGGAFGSHACFYTDSTVLASSSAGIDNMEHALSQLPYVILACVLSVVGYLICGYMM